MTEISNFWGSHPTQVEPFGFTQGRLRAILIYWGLDHRRKLKIAKFNSNSAAFIKADLELSEDATEIGIGSNLDIIPLRN